MKKTSVTLTMIGIVTAVMISISGCSVEFSEPPMMNNDDTAVAEADNDSGDSSQRPPRNQEHKAQVDSLLSEIPENIAKVDLEDVAYELKIRFVDNEGNDLLDPEHPATINDSYIMYGYDGMFSPPSTISWTGTGRTYFTDKNGGYILMKGVIKPGQTRSLLISWAYGYHKEKLTIRHGLDNSYWVDYNNKIYKEGDEIIFSTYKDRRPNLAPISIPIDIKAEDGYSSLLAKGAALHGCDIKVRYEGKDYPVDWTDHGAMSTNMLSPSGGLLGYGDEITSSKIKPDFFGTAYFSQVMPDVFDEDPMDYLVVGFGYFDAGKDFTVEVEIIGSTPMGDFICPVKVTNKVTMVADYPSANTTYYYNGERVSDLHYINLMK